MHVKDHQRLLVLDDEPDVAATICTMASRMGYEADHTSNIDVFFEKSATWDATHLVIDLQLAGGDGVEVIKKLGQLNNKASVIIVSGLGGRIIDAAARSAREHGLVLLGTLSKPFSKKQLQELLNHQHRDSDLFKKDESWKDVSAKDLKFAIDEEKLVSYFQPKLCCTSDDLVGFECLARWYNDDCGFVPPDHFIKVAERHGLINELTRKIYRDAFSNLPYQVKRDKLKIALNLSPLNLEDESFPNWLLTECMSLDIDPEQVILELTETASMDKPLILLECLTQFRIRGFHISIDDFGVGYSSLVQLARLPFSELKIDQTFIKPLKESEEARKIVTAVVGLGRSLELNVVAEGVEDGWALNFLRDIGCNEAQGYFIAHPMSALDATVWKGPSWKNYL